MQESGVDGGGLSPPWVSPAGGAGARLSSAWYGADWTVVRTVLHDTDAGPVTDEPRARITRPGYRTDVARRGNRPGTAIPRDRPGGSPVRW